MLNHDFKNYSTFCELKSDILASRGHLTQLSNCIKSLLGCNDHAPLTSVLLLEKLYQHISGIIGEAFGPYRSNYIVLAKILEILRRILGPLDPKRVVLGGFALVRNVAVQQPETLLHRDQILNELLRGAIIAHAVVALLLRDDRLVAVRLVDLKIASRAIQHLRGALVPQMAQQVLQPAMHYFVALEGALLDRQTFADAAVASPVQVRDDLSARLAREIDDFQLIPQISIHYTWVESIVFAGGAAPVVLEPLLQTVVVKYLLAVAALDIFFLNDVEADGAEEGVDEFLVGGERVLLRHLVVTRQLKDVIVGHFLDFGDEISGFLLHVVLKPRADPEGTLIVHRHYIL